MKHGQRVIGITLLGVIILAGCMLASVAYGSNLIPIGQVLQALQNPDVNLSARYADHLFALCRGKLIAEGKPADVITEELMQKVYQLNCIVMKDPLSGAPLIVPKGKY